jgi:hypothetical protein
VFLRELRNDKKKIKKQKSGIQRLMMPMVIMMRIGVSVMSMTLMSMVSVSLMMTIMSAMCFFFRLAEHICLIPGRFDKYLKSRIQVHDEDEEYYSYDEKYHQEEDLKSIDSWEESEES